MKRNRKGTTRKNALNIMRKMGATFKTSDVIEHGIHPRILYQFRNEGMIEQISRGVYRLTEMPSISNPDITTVVSRAPHVVICLISALSFHHITTQIPRCVSIAIKKDARSPKIDWPPISVHKFSPESFSTGIEKHQIDGITVQIYNVEKTLADCFKYRNKIGMDVVLEALKYYKERKKIKIDEILKYAKINRINKIMMPYLEVIL